MNTQAKISVEPAYDWPELIAFFLLLIGFVLAIGTSVVLNYVLISLAGLVFGRALVRWRKHHRFPTLLIVLGFLAGFLLGAFHTNRKLIVLLFVACILISYHLHKLGWISSEEI